ncbi:MAG: NAD(P)-dependent oxidoreductase [Gammaproteobacteria bacterium]|nr:NAD(P)-dependent oxidoreductase [Gammaproteobacteria bacterium]
MSTTVALTGATGFLGTAIRKALVERAWQVRALTRKDQPEEPGVTWRVGDIGDAAVLRALIRGVDAVIHCAGTVRGSSQAGFDRVNVSGTAAVLTAIRDDAPNARLLFISSLAARAPDLSWYAASKAAAEGLIQAQSPALGWTILRPTAIYGPGDREMRPLFKCLLHGFVPSLQPRCGRFSLLHIDDLVEAVLHWLQHPGLKHQTFELCDGCAGYTTGGIAREAGTVLKRRVRILPLPAWFLMSVSRLNLHAARVFRYSPMLTPGKARELTFADWAADCGAYSRATGWKPRIRFRDALQAGRLFFT